MKKDVNQGLLGEIGDNTTSGDTMILHCPQVYRLPPRHIFDNPYFIGIRGKWTYPLFKMLKHGHAKTFFEDGTLRLGTFFDYARE